MHLREPEAFRKLCRQEGDWRGSGFEAEGGVYLG